MIFYYANTGHKIGLEKVRRGAALLNRLNTQGIEGQLLVNDFRAGLMAKGLGVKNYVTIESIQDIDAIAEHTDSVIIDSNEDDHGRLVKYFSEFKNLWRFEHDPLDATVHGETLIRETCVDEDCVNSMMIGDEYFEQKPKTERTLFFLSDADYDKIILSNAAFFKACNMELLLGNYFFVKYEEDLKKLFCVLHEPEEYTDLITTSSCVVTASAQTALEAKASGAKVIFISTPNALYSNELLASYGIIIVDGFDSETVNRYLNSDVGTEEKQLQKFDDKKIISKL